MPRFRFEHSSDADTVFRLITNPDKLTQRCEALGERNVKVEVSEVGGTTKTQIVGEVEREMADEPSQAPVDSQERSNSATAGSPPWTRCSGRSLDIMS